MENSTYLYSHWFSLLYVVYVVQNINIYLYTTTQLVAYLLSYIIMQEHN